MKMQLFAIRHKPTGFFLPQHKGRAGGSWIEPTESALPKLFHEERHAKGFLTTWLRGGVTAREYQTFEGNYDVDIVETPQPHRRREDMEIVALRLEEVQ